MNKERANQIEELYHAALEVDEQEREAFLRQNCGADEDLRREVESLLSFDEAPAGFLDNLPESFVAEMFTGQESENSLINRQIGRYRVERLLGKGGMGEVYLAEDVRLKRRVALKFLSVTGSGNQNLLRRFEQEAFAVSALNHPNILTVYDFITEEDMNIIAAEYVDGESLRDKINGGLPLNEVLRITEQVAFALSAAHNAGIIHRDIKPENIIIRKDGIVKVLDFGLAKLTEQASGGANSEVKTKKRSLTISGMIFGTPSYMSPEQVRGQKNINGQTDIWSLGIVLFEMITGQVPFSGDTNGDRIASILKTDPPVLSRVIVDCPPELESIINKALAKNVRERYQLMEDFALDVKRLRRRLELEAELKRSNAADVPAQKNSKETKDSDRDFYEASTKNLTKINETSVATEEREVRKSRRLPIFLAAGLLVSFSIAGFIFWKNSAAVVVSNANVSENSNPQNVPTLPERAISYYLNVQKMRSGKPFEEPFRASGREIFENGYKFRMILESDTDGFLYIFNEGKNENGKTEYYLLQPTSPERNSARVKAKQEIRTAYNVFGGGKGTEIVWVIWTKDEKELVENTKKAAIEEGGVVNENNSLRLKEFLLQHNKDNKEIVKEPSNEVTTVKSTGDFIIHRLELEHK